jgi:PAS domain S-box-containing protein
MSKPRTDGSRWQSRRAAAGVAILFLVLGGLWFFFSDAVLLLLPVSPETIAHHQTLKGVAYVVVTAFLAYCLVKKLGGRSQALEALRQSERKYRELLEHANSIILHWTRDGRITFMNEFGQRFFGYSEAEILGQHVVGTIVPETESNGRDLRPLMDQICADPAAFEQNVNENIRRNGEKVWIAWTNKVYFDDQGRVEGILSIGTDITEHKRVEQALHDSELKHRTLFETAGDAIFLIRGDRFIDCNTRTLAMFGCSREQILGAHPFEFSPPTQPDGRRSDESAIEKINQALKERPQLFEWEHYRWDKTPFTAEVSLNSLKLGGEVLLQAIVRDISERKRAEENLRRLNAELEQRVIERTADLAAAKERAESADRLKSAFLAAMSHELRTPLNSIIGFTGIVLQGLPGPLNAEQTKQLGMVQGSARHLLDLINDILDLSKIEAGQLEVEAKPFDVRESVEKVMRLVTPLAEKKKLTLSGDVSPDVGELTSDRRRFEQILINLLNNALKFSEEGHVRVECAINGWDLVTRVKDTGMGIRPEDLEKLFHTFQQIDTGLTRNHEGSGLGLSICKKLVEMMGGKISVENAWGVGSTFTFTVPFGQE